MKEYHQSWADDISCPFLSARPDPWRLKVNKPEIEQARRRKKEGTEKEEVASRNWDPSFPKNKNNKVHRNRVK